MKQIVTNFTFSTGAKTITLTDFNSSHPVDLKRLYLITDTTTNKVLYNFSDSTVASAVISSNNVITLSALQGGESNTDSLLILYDVTATDPAYQVPLLPSNAAQETGGNLATIAGTVSSGKMNVNITSGSLPIGSIELSDGTNTANVVAGDAGFNGVNVNNGTKTIAFSTSTSGAQTLLANTSVEGYAWLTVIVTSNGVGLGWNGQFSATSGGTYVSVSTFIGINQSVNATGTMPTGNNNISHSPVWGNYFQIAISALTSGTVSGYVILSAMPLPPHTMGVTMSSIGNTGTGIPAGASNTGLLAKTSSPTAVATGQMVSMLGNVLGMQVIASALLNSAVAVSASATVVKSTVGYLSGALVTTAGTSQAMTIYDNASTASGTVIGIIPAGATAGQYFPFNMPAANGITCSGSTNNPAVTIAYS